MTKVDTSSLYEAARDMGLSDKEADVLVEAAAGQRNREIARTRNLSHRTVEHQLGLVRDKLGVHTTPHAVALVYEFRIAQLNGSNDGGKNPMAVALGRRGGLKGGKARAAKLSSERRSAIARNAASKRWNSNDSAN